ncbi:DUF4907 domain-containing protein [Spirosoma soli]|uniref:DUF4907 domain-containing protein n=1 Tax=Spirosoma soli TaxID=1770529 RepID=A0ABW5LWH7_9BACT
MPTKASSPITGSSPQGRNLTRQLLLLILVGLAIVTVYQLYRQQPHYRVQVFQTPNGWGYTVLDNGIERIYQQRIPGQSGTKGFASEEQARQVGEQVVLKLQRGKGLPTLTPAELRQLGVTVP